MGKKAFFENKKKLLPWQKLSLVRSNFSKEKFFRLWNNFHKEITFLGPEAIFENKNWLLERQIVSGP